MIGPEIAAGIALVDAVVNVGGPLANALLTVIQGHNSTPEEVKQKAADAKTRLAASSDQMDDAYDQARRNIAAGK